MNCLTELHLESFSIKNYCSYLDRYRYKLNLNAFYLSIFLPTIVTHPYAISDNNNFAILQWLITLTSLLIQDPGIGLVICYLYRQINQPQYYTNNFLK